MDVRVMGYKERAKSGWDKAVLQYTIVYFSNTEKIGEGELLPRE